MHHPTLHEVASKRNMASSPRHIGIDEGDVFPEILGCELSNVESKTLTKRMIEIWSFLVFVGVEVVLLQCEPVASQHPNWSTRFMHCIVAFWRLGWGKKCVILDPYIRLYAASSVTKSSMAYPEIAIRNVEKWGGTASVGISIQ